MSSQHKTITPWPHDPNLFIRTRDNFGGKKGLGSNKTLFADMIHFAASNSDLQNPQIRSWDGTKLVEQIFVGSYQRDHFFELQFLTALFCQIVPDYNTQLMGTKDFEVFLQDCCNNGSNLCYILTDLHKDKNMVMTNLGKMTKPLRDYLFACTADFQKWLDAELRQEQVDLAGTPGQPSLRYYTFLQALKGTPFYDPKRIPNVGEPWWLA